MTGMNELMDKRIKKRQEICSHNYDRLKNYSGVYCSKCAKKLDV